MTPDEKEAQARIRYFVMTFARIAGAALVMFGIVITAGRFEGVPVAAGYVMVVAGLIDIAVVPRMLARKWRTPPEG